MYLHLQKEKGEGSGARARVMQELRKGSPVPTWPCLRRLQERRCAARGGGKTGRGRSDAAQGAADRARGAADRARGAGGWVHARAMDLTKYAAS